MTDRNTFAAAALTGLLSNVPRYQLGPLTEQAFQIADEMIKQSSRTAEDREMLSEFQKFVQEEKKNMDDDPLDYRPTRKERDVWVSVNDRLPPDGETVLWYDADDEVCKYLLGEKDGNGINWGGDLNNPLAGYTHWRHLPGPPTA